MDSLQLQRTRTWLAGKPTAHHRAKVRRAPAVLASGGIIGAAKAWWRRTIWPDAPIPVRELARDNPHMLAMTWYRTMHFAGAGSVGVTLGDMLSQAKASAALQVLLEDFRAGRAQTPEERLIAESLDHVARCYLKA